MADNKIKEPGASIPPEERKKFGKESSHVGFMSSTTRTSKYEKPSSEMDAFMRERWEAILSLWKQYFQCEEFIFVSLTTHPLQTWTEESTVHFPELEVIVIQGDALEQEPTMIPDDGRQVIISSWEPCTSIEYWIDQDWVKPEWAVYAIGKDTDRRAKIKDKCIHIELWADAEDRSGLKFPGCKEYHLLSREQVDDPDNEFIEKEKGCKCGIIGSSFQVRKLQS